MRSPYMDIIEQAVDKPKTFVLPSDYDAACASVIVKQLARTRGIAKLNVRRVGLRLHVWYGAVEEIPFRPPVKKRGRPLGSYKKRPVGEKQLENNEALA